MKKWKNANGWKIIFRNDVIQVFRPSSPVQQIIVLGLLMIVVLWQFVGNNFQDWSYVFIFAFALLPLLIPSPFTLIRRWELQPSRLSFGFQPIVSVSIPLDGNDITLINDSTSVLVWKGDDDSETTRQIYESLSQFLSEKLIPRAKARP